MTRDFAALAGKNRGRYRYRNRYQNRYQKGQEENGKPKAALDRIAAMQTRLGSRSGIGREETTPIPIPTPAPMQTQARNFIGNSTVNLRQHASF
jgi:hypothetical protein